MTVKIFCQEDMVCLSCTGTGERVCLSAEGFGNRQCFLESIVDKNVPPDLSQCVFVIEQALSVRALQEIISSNDAEAVSGKHKYNDIVKSLYIYSQTFQYLAKFRLKTMKTKYYY